MCHPELVSGSRESPDEIDIIIKMKKNTKLIVILGPTGSGKTSMAVQLAKEFNGEIISADSRQVYRGMDIGTGKDLKEYVIESKVKSTPSATIEGRKSKVDFQNSQIIPYHLIDVVEPQKEFNLAQYKKLADKAIKEVADRGKLPLLVGGSGLYLQSVVDNFQLSKIKVNQELRDHLETLEADKLYKILEDLNPAFAEKIQDSDRKNKRRLIRYIEINHQGKFEGRTGESPYEVLILGLDVVREELNKRIKNRLLARLDEGMIEEVEKLHKEGVSWKRLEDFGLEYRFVGRYLQNKYPYDEMVEKLNIAIRQFAKRQVTWFKRWEKQGRVINWISSKEEAKKLIKEFLK
ncbi:MAG: tRNA dimethylallyltransferase [Parcubacteria group bacterium GW2011_GWE2_39_37]|uniref:tRNA dimethylallyltransferase n=1 Tax=Candidatus Falkowbacteria bacterium GW2011_GWF2_39_8 TaxID=1618642 RepID=A0A0G0Q3P0_9BACT|nr:MAG: tRNA dimethylallyltransferase [Parcubacteria group bacterium GW2011_GWE2_39_37]KKR31996.1 MAG: tRNA dimethylallyltransferase [Candidatus Falkowbacteria bacterium GW2011_GWF2_39_8]